MHTKLNIEEKKLALIHWLSGIDDPQLIDSIMELKDREQADWWDQVSEAEKASIEKGLADAESGKLEPHSTARKRYEKWL